MILEQEDTDGDFQISITDAGPKILALGTATSNGFKSFDIRVCIAFLQSRSDGTFADVFVLRLCRRIGDVYAVKPLARTCPSARP